MKNIIIEQTSSQDFLNQIGSLIDDKLSIFFAEKNNHTEDESLKLLTIEETANLLGISKTSVYNYTKRGFLKPQRIGKTTRYFKGEVLNCLNQEL